MERYFPRTWTEKSLVKRSTQKNKTVDKTLPTKGREKDQDT